MFSRHPVHLCALIIVFVGLTNLAVPRTAAAQDECSQFFPPPPDWCYGVQVDPKGGLVTRTAFTGGYSELFTVTNLGNSDTYQISCQGTGGVTCTGTSVSSMNPGYQTPVTAFYTVGAPGNGTLTLYATGAHASDAGWISVQVVSYGVAVTVDNGTTPTRVPNTSGYTQAFTVQNTGSDPALYSLTCSVVAPATCTGLGPASINLAAGASGQVTVAYGVGNAGNGRITLRASNAQSADTGWYNVPVSQPPGAPIVDVSPYNFAKQDYKLCAVSCFAVVYAQSTVPYFSLNTPRGVTLVHNSDRVNPRPFVHVNVTPDLSYGTPVEYRLEVKINGAAVTFVNGESVLKFAYPGSVTARIGGQFDAATNGAGSTNVYPMDIVVTALYGGGPVSTTIPTKLAVVNETNASVAAGWTIGGVQRLYTQTDGSALITEADGSAVYFWNVGGAFLPPAGEFSTLIGSTSWTRTHPDGSVIEFDASGRMTESRDRFFNRTKILYDGNDRVWKIADPIGDTIRLAYNGTIGLQSIQDAAMPARTTGVSVDASRKLTAITDPDGVPTRFVFDATLQLGKVVSRRGDTTQFAYHTGSRKLQTITLPPVPIHATGSVSPVMSQSPWQLVGVPYSATATTPAPAPRADTVTARETDPRGYVTKFTVNRFGLPLVVTDAVGGITTLTYDANGLPVRTLWPTGAVDSVVYNPNALPTFIQPAGLTAINVRYGSFAQPDSIWGSGRPTIAFKLTSNGLVEKRIVAGQDTTRFTHDTRGRVLTVTDPQGHLLIKHTYAGAHGNVSRDSVPGGRVTTYLQDGVGRDTAVQAPSMPLRRTHYDVLNRPTEAYDGVHPTPTVTAYDSLFVRSVTDPKGQVYGFARNALGWLTQQTDPAGRSQLYAYDPNGNLKRWTNRRVDSIVVVYDALNRPTTKSGSNTAAASWDYSLDRRVVTSTSPGLDTETVYLNVAGLADSVRTKLAGQTYWRRARYTPAGLLDTVDITGGGIVFRARKYVYSSQFNLLTEIHLAGAITSIAYNKDHQDTSITFPGGDRIRKMFFPLHRATQISTSAAYNGTIARSMGFDSLARIRQQVIGDGSTGNRYTYDGVGRLRSDTQLAIQGSPPPPPPPSCDGNPPPIVDEFGNSCVEGGGGGGGGSTWQVTGGTAFTYDSVGNRRDQGGTYLPGNRITGFAECTYTTDYDGNVTSRTCGSQTTTFFWSAESRLDSLTTGTQRIGFRYDAADRVIRRDLNGSPQSHFLWDGDNLLAELNATGTTVLGEYSYYPGLDNLHALIVGSTQYNAHVDGAGNVIALTDGAQSVKRTYAYDAWGNVTGGADIAGFNGVDRARFKGALWLGAEAEVYNMRARWYEPKTGRFLSEDPIGLEGGINQCVYAGNDPINNSDPTGLDCITFYVEESCTSIEGQEECEPGYWKTECSGRGGAGGGGGGPFDGGGRNGGGGAFGDAGQQPQGEPASRPQRNWRECASAAADLVFTAASDILTFAGGAGVLMKALRVGRMMRHVQRYGAAARLGPMRNAHAAARLARVQRDIAAVGAAGAYLGDFGGGSSPGRLEQAFGTDGGNGWDLVPVVATGRAIGRTVNACKAR